jgi:hypothetical protein
MSNIMKGLQTENNDFQVNVPGYGTMPLEMLKNHVKELTKDFNDTVQNEEFIKAAYRTEQLYNALFALSKAMKAKSKELDETHSTGTTVGSAGIGGGAGLGIEKSPIEKVIEKPLGETIQSSQGGMGQSYRKFTPKSAGVAEGAPELLKKEMPTHRHAEKLLAQNGVNKDDPDYHKHLANTIQHLRKFGNIDLINKQDVDEEQAPMFTPEERLDELSPETLARYKKAAGADARKADSEGDYKRGDKRFSGIVRATKKEFDHDAKSAKKESSIMKGLQTEEINEDALTEGMVQKLAGLALGAALAFAPQISSADTVYSYLSPHGTGYMKSTNVKERIPADSKVVFAVDTETNEVTMIKGTMKGQEVQPDPQAVKQGQQQSKAEPASQPIKTETLYGSLQKGMSIEQVKNKFPDAKEVKSDLLTSLELVDDNDSVLKVNLKSPLGTESSAYLTFDNNKLSTVNFIEKFSDYGIEIKPESGSFTNKDLTKQEFANSLRQVASKTKATSTLGSPIGKISFNKIDLDPGLAAGIVGLLGDPQSVAVSVPFSNGNLSVYGVSYNGKNVTPSKVIYTIGKNIPISSNL